MAITSIRQLPLVELVPVLRFDADDILDQVRIFGDYFDTTFVKVMWETGMSEPVRAPIAVVRRKIRDYVPNFLNTLVEEEKRKLERGCPRAFAEVPLH